MHRTDAAVVDALHAGGDLVMNVAGFEHGSRLVFPVLWRQSAFDSLLAIPENLGVVSFHSKWPFVGCDCCCDKLNSTSIYGHFELLFCNRSEYHAYNRTSDHFIASGVVPTVPGFPRTPALPKPGPQPDDRLVRPPFCGADR